MRRNDRGSHLRPILMSFSFRVVSDQSLIGSGVATCVGNYRDCKRVREAEGSGANGKSGAYSPQTRLWRKRTRMLSMDELFKGRHFDREIIILCVRWYLRFKLSFRDLVEMMAERGISLAHTTIMRWIPALCSGIRKAVEPLRLPGRRILAGRRNLREDQRPLDLSLSCGRQSKERPSISCSAPSGMSLRPKRFSGGRSRARAGCRTRSRLMAIRLRIGRRGKSSANIGAASEPKSDPQNI